MKTINFDPNNLKAMCELMDEFGGVNDMFFGKNEDDEEVQISIAHDNIVVVTMQSNGWIRKNVYYRDGEREELFDGRWK